VLPRIRQIQAEGAAGELKSSDRDGLRGRIHDQNITASA
jgi:hypothetical protein